MPLTVEQLTERLTSSGVISEDELRDWFAAVPVEKRPSDGEALARELVKQKKLTKFQAEQIYAGKGSSLTLGNYVILDKLGQGGMGMVLKAMHRRMERIVAIKVMSPDGMKSPDAVQRFHREVKAAAKLSHPNIVAAHDADEAKGTHFLVMEFVDGSDLSALVKKKGPFPAEQAIQCIIQAARGLEFAHEQGVIHRDIKPANLLIDAKGTVKILDMGLARIDDSVGGSSEGAGLTSTGTIMGTVDYISPEQAMDTKHADARSDIYSLGCSLYYLLTGRSLYDGDTIMKKLIAHREAAVPELRSPVAPRQESRASLGSEAPTGTLRVDGRSESESRSDSATLNALNAAFRRMVAKKPEDRPQSMTEVIAELERCLASDSATVTLQRNPGSSVSGSSGSGNELQDFLKQISGGANAPSSPTAKGFSRTAAASSDSAMEATMISSADGVSTDPQTLTSVMKSAPKSQNGSALLSSRRNQLIAGLTAAVLMIAGIVWWSTSKPVAKTDESVAADGSKKKKTKSSGAKSEPPPLAVAPFDAKQARAHQEAWANHLGTQVETTNSVGQKMMLIPPGEFMMGSTDEQVAAALKVADEIKTDPGVKGRIEIGERPQHKVVITKPFLLSATEVTIGQFKKFAAATSYQTEAEKAEAAAKAAPPVEAGQSPPKPIQTYLNPGKTVTDDLPAAFITWNDAVAYCQWLSSQEKRVYRLPTEAEWEYACRAGTTTQYSFGDEYNELPRFGWYNRNSGSQLHPVGALLPNPFGLFDMHGNIYEWCGDFHDEKWYASSTSNDPSGPSAGSSRVVRGGDWYLDASYCRSASRGANLPSNRHRSYGFRYVLELNASPTSPLAVSTPKLFMHDPAFPQWMKDVQAMSAEKQIEAVSKKLMELNPGFDGKLTDYNGKSTPQIMGGQIVSLGLLSSPSVSDISPVRVFAHLKSFNCSARRTTDYRIQGSIADLSSIKDLPLTMLSIRSNDVTNLTPLEGMKLTTFECSFTKVSDLTALVGMPLSELHLQGSPVSDLSPLTGMPLTNLGISSSRVTDLSPLLKCKTLVELSATKLRLTPTQVAELQAQLPACEINWDRPKTPASTPSASVKPWETPEFQDWVKGTQALPTDEQIEAVRKKLVELNRGFDGNFKTMLKSGEVEYLEIISDNITDLSPIRAFRELSRLFCHGSFYRMGKLSDLSPLRGMQLKFLNIQFNPISDFSPLAGMPLTHLNCDDLPVVDLTPLAGMPLEQLLCRRAKASDFSVVTGIRTLKLLDVRSTQISPAAADALQKALPNCKVERDDPTKLTPPQPQTSSKLFMHDPAFPQWLKDVQAMPAEQQIEAVSKKLVELNPGFDGKLMGMDSIGHPAGSPKIEGGSVTEISCHTDEIADLSPVRGLAGLTRLCCESTNKKSKLSDLSPLEGMRLTHFMGGYAAVSDLIPLRGMPLRRLGLGGTRVVDLSPLQGMPLVGLYVNNTPLNDLAPLKEMPLESVLLDRTQIKDLSPLETCSKLKTLNVTQTKVTAAQVAALQKALPNCKVDWDDPAKAKTQ